VSQEDIASAGFKRGSKQEHPRKEAPGFRPSVNSGDFFVTLQNARCTQLYSVFEEPHLALFPLSSHIGALIQYSSRRLSASSASREPRPSIFYTPSRSRCIWRRLQPTPHVTHCRASPRELSMDVTRWLVARWKRSRWDASHPTLSLLRLQVPIHLLPIAGHDCFDALTRLDSSFGVNQAWSTVRVPRLYYPLSPAVTGSGLPLGRPYTIGRSSCMWYRLS